MKDTDQPVHDINPLLLFSMRQPKKSIKIARNLYIIVKKRSKGSFINHVVKFLRIFDPLPPSWSLLLNKAYVIKWSFG